MSPVIEICMAKNLPKTLQKAICNYFFKFIFQILNEWLLKSMASYECLERGRSNQFKDMMKLYFVKWALTFC